MTRKDCGVFASIRAAFSACDARVDRTAINRWRVGLTNGRALDVEAHAEEGWLSLLADTDTRADVPVELLRSNHRLAGSSRIAQALDTGRVRLRSDVPLGDGVDLVSRVSDACAGLKDASDRLQVGPRPGGDTESMQADERPLDAAVAEVCRETGRPCVERPSGALVMALDGGGAGHHAVIEARSGTAAALSVEIVRVERGSSAVHRAIGALLLGACDALRFTRPSVSLDGDALTARFELQFGTPPSAAELDEALRALGAACRLYGREADVLRDEAVSRFYLTRLGVWADERRTASARADTARLNGEWSWRSMLVSRCR